MSNELKTTFSDMPKAAFQIYAHDLCEGYPTGPERQRLQAYMFQTIAQDKKGQATTQFDLNTKRARSRDHQDVLEELVLEHAHDYNRSTSLFQEQTKTDQEILDLLKLDDTEVYIKDRDITGEVLLQGDRVKFCGLGATGSAADDDLEHTCIVTGRLIISGSDVTLEGLHFKHASEWTDGATEAPMISFTSGGGSSNTKLTLKNCTFEMTGSHADGRFFCGLGSGGGGPEHRGLRDQELYQLDALGRHHRIGNAFRQARQLRTGRVPVRELHGINRGAGAAGGPQRVCFLHQQRLCVRQQRAARPVLGHGGGEQHLARLRYR